MITVYWSDTNLLLQGRELRDYLSLLPASLQQKIQVYRAPADQAARCLGKLMLQDLLRTALNGKAPGLDQLAYTAAGKPYFPGSGIDFSITHSGQLVLCALADQGHVGIDAEQVKPVTIIAFRDYFTEAEWTLLMQELHPDELFYRLWTRKEVVLKAMGAGMLGSLQQIEVLNNPVVVQGKSWQVHPLSIHQDFVAHLATDDPDARLQVTAFKLPE